MVKCNICSSEKIDTLQPVYSHYFTETPPIYYTLYACQDCGSNFFDLNENNDRISLDDMYERLDGDNASLNHEFKKSRSRTYVKSQIDAVLGYNPQSVLDVGCRTGDFLMHMDDSCRRVGVELSAIAANIARERGLEVYTDFVEDIEFDTQFDIVTAFAVLEHLQRPHEFLSSLQKWVKKDGIFVLLIPSHECIKEKVATMTGQTWRMYTPPSHLNFYSRAWLDDYFLKAGFKLEKRFHTSGGCFNPFSKIPVLRTLFSIFMHVVDISPLNRTPIFDHQYSIYRKL